MTWLIVLILLIASCTNGEHPKQSPMDLHHHYKKLAVDLHDMAYRERLAAGVTNDEKVHQDRLGLSAMFESWAKECELLATNAQQQLPHNVVPQ